MILKRLLIRTQAWVQEEIAAQGRLHEILGRQEEAIRTGSTETVMECGAALEAEIAKTPVRDRRRRELLIGFAHHFDVPADTLTLTSIATRAAEEGVDSSTLTALRDELRTRVAAVVGRSRRIAGIAHYHRGLLGDVIKTLADGTDKAGTQPAGVLVDEEG